MKPEQVEVLRNALADGKRVLFDDMIVRSVGEHPSHGGDSAYIQGSGWWALNLLNAEDLYVAERLFPDELP